jgi:hypothetical protein
MRLTVWPARAGDSQNGMRAAGQQTGAAPPLQIS